MSSFCSSFISGRWKSIPISPTFIQTLRNFRSKAALDALTKASKDKTPNLVLYNYPSFSGAFSALFAHLYHSHLNLPCLILPFSSVEPLRVDDLKIEGLDTCYLLDFVGPKGFASEVSQSTNRVVVFDHRKTSLSKIPQVENCPKNITFRINIDKSSSSAVYDYFSNNLTKGESPNGEVARLLKCQDKDRLEMVLKYIEDEDLRRRILPDVESFNIGLSELRSELNCITNPYVFDQLLEVSPTDLIARGKSYVSSRQDAANKLLDKTFKLQLGKGFYGECLGIRADGYSYLSNEIGRELSVRSAKAGLRPIGAVIYMQRHNLKMCLRSIDSQTDTSEIAKAYGGGGTSGSSSFIVRMDEYNQWVSANSS